MITVFYKRDFNHNYLVIESMDESAAEKISRGESYQIEMLRHNSIEGLLPFHLRLIDEKVYFYYEISSKQPIRRILEQSYIFEERLRKIIIALNRTLIYIQEYLLDSRHLILDPEYVYMNIDTCEPEFLFDVEYESSFGGQICGFAEYLLDRVDHTDEKAVILAYQFYKYVREDNFIMNRIMEFMESMETQASPVNKVHLFEENVYHQKSALWKEPVQQEAALEEAETVLAEKYQQNTINKKIIHFAGIGSILLLLACLLVNNKISFLSLQAQIIICGIAGMLFCLEILKRLLTYYRKKSTEIKGIEKEDTENKENRKKEQGEIQLLKTIQDVQSFEGVQQEKENEPQIILVDFEQDYGNTVLLGTGDTKDERKLICMIKGKEVEIEIKKIPFVLGKAKELVDCEINDTSVSRMHARITEEEDKLYLEDCNSTNGTFKNGLRLETNEKVPISRGDEITLGKIKFVYH